MTISGDLRGKRFAFEMEFDPAFNADARLLDFLQKGKLYEPDPTSGVSKLIDSYINGLLAISSFRHHRSVGAGSGRDLLEDGRQDDA